MLIENHGGITADPEVIVRIVEGVGFAPIAGQQRLRTPPDVDPTPLYDTLARIAPFAGLIHAKTVWFSPSSEHLGYDAHRTLRIVRDAGFAGPVSLEYGGGVDAWTNIVHTKRIVEDVFGGD